MNEKDLSILEETIDYKFNDQKYLKIALTHKSYLDEEPGYLSNQRYEFLGDTPRCLHVFEWLRNG